MGKKKHRSGYNSKGQRLNVSNDVSTRPEGFDRVLRWVRDWKRGKDPTVRMDGTRVRANTLWGDPKGKNNMTSSEE